MKDDRGELDLTRRLDDMQDALNGWELLAEMQKKEIHELKKSQSEVLRLQNLLQGYKKVIEELTAKLIRKDS
jgi:hypothetical protein|tara:strand:+ start:24 stop:239 length:216 start_codon:yes stop_codon:yes gene_type:complete